MLHDQQNVKICHLSVSRRLSVHLTERKRNTNVDLPWLVYCCQADGSLVCGRLSGPSVRGRGNDSQWPGKHLASVPELWCECLSNTPVVGAVQWLRRLVTLEAWLRSQVSICVGFVVEKIDILTVLFPPRISVFPCQYSSVNCACLLSPTPVAYSGFFLGGGVQQIQLRTERTGIWGR